MSLETEIKELVKRHYTTESLTKTTLLKVDEEFGIIINKYLLLDVKTPSKEEIEPNYRKLCIYFHPDKIKEHPEVMWLEEHLSEGRNNGICFTTLTRCYDQQVNPQKFKEVDINDINTRDEFRVWLESLKNNADTYTMRNFYQSLVTLLDQASGFFDDVGNIKPKALRVLISSLPLLFSTYGAVICSQQLFAVYAFYFLMLKGGQYLERNSSLELKVIGKALQQLSVITATVTTTLLIRLVEMIFWISRQSFDMTLQLGSAILNPLLPANPKEKIFANPTEATNLCEELLKASKNLSTGIRFETPELKLLAAPLEHYLQLNGQSFLQSYRIGATKGEEVTKVLTRIQNIDKESVPLEKKLEAVEKELKRIETDPRLFTKRTKEAVKDASEVLALYKA